MDLLIEKIVDDMKDDISFITLIRDIDRTWYSRASSILLTSPILVREAF